MDFNITVHSGSPDCNSRLKKEIECYDLLDGLGIKYECADHPPAASTDECVGVEQALNVHICKNLFLCDRKKKQFFMLTMRGDKHFVTREFSKMIGAPRLSFAPEDKMLELLNITPGSVSILGLKYDTENQIKFYIDKDLLNDEFFGCHPCINTSSLKIRMEDVLHKIFPALRHEYTVVDLENTEEI